jgi:thiamine-monophosphate kinase
LSNRRRPVLRASGERAPPKLNVATMLKEGRYLTQRAPNRTLPGELALIEAIREHAQRIRPGKGALWLGIGDDCAILRPKPGYEICVTTDFSLEGRHFLRSLHTPESAGHRCLTRGLSDLAAMGAEPLAAFLSLAIPAGLTRSWAERFLRGLLALAKKHRVPLAGGDTAESAAPEGAHEGTVAADIVAIGQVPRGRAVLRSGAQPGDAIYVTGALGGAAAELQAARENPRRFARLMRAAAGHPHFWPEARIAVGRQLRGRAHAMIDISDGLATDLTHICQESGLAAVLDEAALPVHTLAARAPSPRDLALNGGEDYELLFTAPSTARIGRRIAGVPIHRIGTMRKPVRSQGLIVLKTAGEAAIAVEAGGWEHFQRGFRREKQET